MIHIPLASMLALHVWQNYPIVWLLFHHPDHKRINSTFWSCFAIFDTFNISFQAKSWSSGLECIKKHLAIRLSRDPLGRTAHDTPPGALVSCGRRCHLPILLHVDACLSILAPLAPRLHDSDFPDVGVYVGRQEGHPACKKFGIGLLVVMIWL